LLGRGNVVAPGFIPLPFANAYTKSRRLARCDSNFECNCDSNTSARRLADRDTFPQSGANTGSRHISNRNPCAFATANPGAWRLADRDAWDGRDRNSDPCSNCDASWDMRRWHL